MLPWLTPWDMRRRKREPAKPDWTGDGEESLQSPRLAGLDAGGECACREEVQVPSPALAAQAAGTIVMLSISTRSIGVLFSPPPPL